MTDAPHEWTHWYDRDTPYKEPLHGDVVINLRSPIEQILGHAGRMISASKSYYHDRHPEHEVIFNACLFDRNREEVWYGDLDLTLDGEKLQQVAELVGEIWVTPEQPFRWEGLPEDLSELSPWNARRIWCFRHGEAPSQLAAVNEDGDLGE